MCFNTVYTVWPVLYFLKALIYVDAERNGFDDQRSKRKVNVLYM